MRIAIFSDCHAGYAWGEERQDDSFAGLEEAIIKSKGADLILIAGDLFDSRIPRPEVFARVARILSTSREAECATRLIEFVGRDSSVPRSALAGIPVVAIHGTHERRSRQLINPVQALEHAGLLIHLHCGSAVFDVGGKKVAVHGMSGVPERYAKECLLQWRPRPVQDAINILMLHQSIDPYIYSPLEPPSLKLEDLPPGFDLYVLGHMHWSDVQRFRGANLLVPGSTTPTTVHKTEAGQAKAIFNFDGNIVERSALSSQRKIMWREFEFGPDVRQQIEAELGKLPETKPKPIAAIKVKGTVGPECPMPNFSDIEQRFADRAIININRALHAEGFVEQAELLAALRQTNLSPEETGLRLLVENLRQTGCGIKVEDIFELLVDGQADAIFNALMGGQR